MNWRRLCLALTLLVTTVVFAEVHQRSPYMGAMVLDAENGRVLFADRAEAEAYPASVTKLMTLLLVIEDVDSGRYSLDDLVTATTDAYMSESSWIGIKAGERMSVRDLCIALMVHSANDAAMVLAVNSAGSFEAFVAKMNERARQLGMTKTRYYNPSGLPPNPALHYRWKNFNVTTARDQSKLALELLRHHHTLEFTSVKACDLIRTAWGYRIWVTIRANAPESSTRLADGEKIERSLLNHNNIMRTDKQKIVNPDGSEAVDGLKTGFINAGGSSIVLTGSRNGKRVVVVVLGSTSSTERDSAARLRLVDALGSLTW